MISGCGVLIDSGVQTSASKVLGSSIKIDNTLRSTSGSLGIDTSALSTNHLIVKGSSGCLVDSGVSASSTNFISGSGNSIISNASASNVRMDINVVSPLSVAGSQISHANSGVSAATYTLSSVTVDSTGHITSASSGIIATPAQVTSGSSNTALVSASGLASSDYGKRTCFIPLNQGTALVGGETQYVRIDSIMNGWRLVGVNASCSGSSTSGSPRFTVKSGSQTMLSTDLTIDQGEYDSSTAISAAVINSTYATVSTGAKIWVASVSGSSGSAVTYAGVGLTFSK
jgi:hypothetical protein